MNAKQNMGIDFEDLKIDHLNIYLSFMVNCIELEYIME